MALCFSDRGSDPVPFLSERAKTRNANKRPSEVTGDGWLAWSPAERTEYIDTYLDAYSTAYYDACRSAEDIFIEESSSAKGAHMAKLPYEKDDENSTDIPLSHCMNRQAKYSRRQRGPDVLFVSPYPEIITEMYQKHPDGPFGALFAAPNSS